MSPLLTYSCRAIDQTASCSRSPTDTSASSSASAPVETFNCTNLKDFSFSVSPDDHYAPGFGLDTTGSLDYLRDVLQIVQRLPANGNAVTLVPLYTSGDGHCLVHAVSRALVGHELLWHPLQMCIWRHLEQNVDLYKERFVDLYLEKAEWNHIIAESNPAFSRDTQMRGLGVVHIQALANILKRPIILLEDMAGIRSAGYYSCLFLPFWKAPEERRANAEPSLRPEIVSPHQLAISADSEYHTKPLCIAWNNRAHSHFVPLVSIQDFRSRSLYVSNHLTLKYIVNSL